MVITMKELNKNKLLNHKENELETIKELNKKLSDILENIDLTYEEKSIIQKSLFASEIRLEKEIEIIKKPL